MSTAHPNTRTRTPTHVFRLGTTVEGTDLLRHPGPDTKPSVTRLVIVVALLGCTIALVTLICWYVVTRPQPDPLVINAIVGGVTALVVNGLAALWNRGVMGGTHTAEVFVVFGTRDRSPQSRGDRDAPG